MSIKIEDPNLSHYIYCRDQQEQIKLMDIQLGAAGFHDVAFDDGVATSLRKGAFLSALLLTMSHALEKGKKPVDVASDFFDVATIEQAAPELKSHNEGVTFVQTLSEKAKMNAATRVTQNLCLLMEIAHFSLKHGTFAQQEELKKDFKQALTDNRWPLDFSDHMETVFDTDFQNSSNEDIDRMLLGATEAHKNQREQTEQDINPEEYRILS